MTRYAIKVQYDGTAYVGYQIQNNGLSVQAAIETGLRKIAKLPKEERIYIVGSGRTDAGVHALGQVIHFDYPGMIAPHALQRALNSVLDKGINVVAVEKVSPSFHARYDVQEKAYLYRVDIGPFPDPFKRLYTLHHPYKCDLTRMQVALQALEGQHDFTSFCSIKTDKVDKVRTLYQAKVSYHPQLNELHFNLCGNGFLYNMVRIIVGTTLQIGDGLKPVDELKRLIEVKERKQAGPTAPAHGLYLQYVTYPVPLFKSEKEVSN